MSGRTSSTANAETVSRVNQTAILDVLRQHGPQSRQEIGARTGLSAATVNRLASQLLRKGLVIADGQQPSTGGRPSILLRYSGRAHLVSVVHIGATRTEGALVDFDGTIVHRVQRPVVPDVLHAADRATIRLEEALSVVTELGAAAAGRGQPSQAIGVVVPGVVDGADGRVTWAPALDWREVPVGSLLADRTGLPVVVENDANVLAVGEHHRGAGRGVQDLVAVVLGTGIGTGIVTGGRLHRGSRAAAGEIGYMLLDRSSLGRLFPGFGDLESRVGSAGLTRQARERGLAAPADRPLTAADVFDLVRTGSVEARALLEETLDYVALAVANLCTVLDPELVIVGGEMGGAADLITPGLRDRLVGRIPHVPRLAASELGDDAAVVGAAELAARLVSDAAYVQPTR